MEFLNFYSLPPLISSILFLLMGAVVYKNNTKASLNVSFFWLCVTTFVWQFVMFLLFNTKSPYLGEIFVRLAHVGIILLPVAVYHFALSLVGKIEKIDKYFLYINYVFAFIFQFCLFTDWFIAGFHEYYWSFYPKAGILHPLYVILLTTVAVRLLYILVKSLEYKKNISVELYEQTKIVLWAIVFYIFASSDFLLNYGVEFYPIGFIFILIFMGITSYSIVRHQFMDISIVLRQSSVYFLSFLFVMILLLAFNFGIGHGDYYYTFLNIFFVLILLILFPYIKFYFFKLANRYFFTSLYDSKEVITDLSQKLRTTLDLDYIYELISDSIDSSFHADAFGFLVYDSQEHKYVFKYKIKNFTKAPDTFKGDFKLHQYYTKKNKVFVTSGLRENESNFNNISNVFKKIGIEVLVPVNIKWRNIGILAVGRKRSKDLYSKEDISLLEIIGGLAATSIDNGLLYKSISENNKKLEDLLAMKTDFLRIANHQLNTPLSIMRLAFSSIEEKALSSEEGLKMARKGLDRLSDTISELWTVFEIESDELTLNEEVFDLKSLCDEILENKTKTDLVKEKKLQLFLKVQDGLLQTNVKADKKRIKEVISRILDNACFYTKAGSIHLSLEKFKDNRFLKLSVIDTGVGVREEEKQTIFEKFFRGKEAVLLHPDGSGIGLFVARNIIEASQGEFWLEKSKEGEGSVFSFTLPRVII